MSRVLLACILIINSLACGDPDSSQLPEDEVLIELLTDLHLAETAMTRVNALNQDSVSTQLRQRVARAHDISPERMDQWLEELQKSPDRLMVIYDSVIVRLERSVPGQ
jgi:hypothetical protein